MDYGMDNWKTGRDSAYGFERLSFSRQVLLNWKTCDRLINALMHDDQQVGVKDMTG